MLLIMALEVAAFCLDAVIKPVTFYPRTPILSASMNATIDSIYNALNKTSDTINNSLIRWNALKDTTFSKSVIYSDARCFSIGRRFSNVMDTGMVEIYPKNKTATGNCTMLGIYDTTNNFAVFSISLYGNKPQISMGNTFSVSAYTNTISTNCLLSADSAVIAKSRTPTSSADSYGTTGQIVWDTSYIYVKYNGNRWKRAALLAW